MILPNKQTVIGVWRNGDLTTIKSSSKNQGIISTDYNKIFINNFTLQSDY
jgi:V8-like Glu-specific endopeptidase